MPLAEDGYFGPETLRKKKELESTRQAQIDALHEEYKASIKRISDNIEEELQALRSSSDPFESGRKSSEIIRSELEDSTDPEKQPEPELAARVEPSSEPQIEIITPVKQKVRLRRMAGLKQRKMSFPQWKTQFPIG